MSGKTSIEWTGHTWNPARRWKPDPNTVAMRRENAEVFDRRIPQGDSGLTFIYSRFMVRGPAPDVSDCLVERPRPWLLTVWEPLPTKAPAPPKATPYCCYINTVIFYCSPNIVRPWSRLYRGAGGRLQASKGNFEEWDRIETRFNWDDRVAFQGDEFEITGGKVMWARKRWWMRRGARRVVAGRRAA